MKERTVKSYDNSITYTLCKSELSQILASVIRTIKDNAELVNP